MLPQVLPSRLFGKEAPSKKITMGFIGVGGHGTGINLRNFLNLPGARVLAVCDVQRSHAARAKAMVDKQYGDASCAQYEDFREILARKDIDAIVISTPDH